MFTLGGSPQLEVYMSYKETCIVCKIVLAVLVIGALNWGLVGLFGYNVVDHLLGVGSVASRVVYSVVGLAGLALLASFFVDCPYCKK